MNKTVTEDLILAELVSSKKADKVEQYKELLEKVVEDMMEVGHPGTFFFLGMKSDMQMKVENIILAQAECTLLRGFGSGQGEMPRVQDFLLG